jgi:hypothetical protein
MFALFVAAVSLSGVAVSSEQSHNMVVNGAGGSFGWMGGYGGIGWPPLLLIVVVGFVTWLAKHTPVIQDRIVTPIFLDAKRPFSQAFTLSGAPYDPISICSTGLGPHRRNRLGGLQHSTPYAHGHRISGIQHHAAR